MDVCIDHKISLHFSNKHHKKSHFLVHFLESEGRTVCTLLTMLVIVNDFLKHLLFQWSCACVLYWNLKVLLHCQMSNGCLETMMCQQQNLWAMVQIGAGRRG